MPFFILFILIPLAELMVFVSVSNVIGLGTALLMSLLTAILGGSIVRYQGIQTMLTAQSNLRRGILPSKELFDGLCLVAAGAMLITPGFITDTIGFALLVPAVREFLRRKLINSGKFQASAGFGSEHPGHNDPFNEPYSNPYDYRDSGVIDAEYETLDEELDRDKRA